MATTWVATTAVILTVTGMSLPPDDPGAVAVLQGHHVHHARAGAPGDRIGVPRDRVGVGGPRPGTRARVRPKPLAGRTIAIDPGHQLGNSRHPHQISRRVPAGGFMKACNTTGTATNAGFPEATFNFLVAQRLRTHLRHLGARVIMTRYRNSYALHGPCVDYRGRFGNKQHADLKISIHGDASYSHGHGFHVIVPTWRKRWTADIYRASKTLANKTRHGLINMGFSVANYTARGSGIDFRNDLATLNLSNIPVVLVECGNMRNPHDAGVMSSRLGRDRYARGLLHGIRAFLRR
jgi:N-acetylmuramoyl-L-alanine amidase